MNSSKTKHSKNDPESSEKNVWSVLYLHNVAYILLESRGDPVQPNLRLVLAIMDESNLRLVLPSDDDRHFGRGETYNKCDRFLVKPTKLWFIVYNGKQEVWSQGIESDKVTIELFRDSYYPNLFEHRFKDWFLKATRFVHCLTDEVFFFIHENVQQIFYVSLRSNWSIFGPIIVWKCT